MTDLERLYQARADDENRVPVIIIPGVLGSRLAEGESGIERWPGSTGKLLTSGYHELALRVDPLKLEPINDGLVASGLFDAAAGQDFYRKIVRALREVGGYELSRPGEPLVQRRARLYTFPYDWRQDNIITVRKLDDFIEQIRRDYGQPDLRVDVIAHSMGGMIVRYYERYGTDDVLDGNTFPVTGAGGDKLRRIVLLGTPNQGTVTAVHSFLNGYRVAVSSLPTEGVATMPAMYQLFPNPLVDWLATTDGRPLERDLFDVNLWRRFQWSIFDPGVQRRIARHSDIWPEQAVFERWFGKWLERARRFAWSLMVPSGDVKLIEPLLLGGDCVPTPRLLVVEGVGGDSVVRLRPEQILKPVRGIDYERLMYEPGDGKVTKSSLLGRQALDPSVPRNAIAKVELDRAFFVCEQHDSLTANIDFINNMLSYLLSAES